MTIEDTYEEFTKEFVAQQEEDKALTIECSMFLQKRLLHKREDPGRFSSPCSIGEVKVDQALFDLGSSINVIPLLLLNKLNLGEPKTTKTIELTLADNYVIKSCGLIEDVLVKIKDLMFLVDFVILDMKEDDGIQIILGKPFLHWQQLCFH
jgi:hypothetical protein